MSQSAASTTATNAASAGFVIPVTEFEMGKKVHVLYNLRAKGKKRTSLYSAEILATTNTYIRIRFDADNIGPREYSVTPKSCYHVPTRRSPKWSPSKDDVVLVHIAPTLDRAAAPPVAAHMDPAEKDLLFETVAFCAVARIHEIGVPGSVSVTWLDVNRSSPARVKLDDVVPVSPQCWNHFYKVDSVPTPIDVLGLSILSSRKRTRDDGDANDGAAGDDDDDDAELAALDDVNHANSAANGANGPLERAWSPIDADEAAEAERIKRAEEAFKKLVSVRTEAEHKLLQAARERRFIRLRRSTRFVESSGHERLLPPQPNEPSVAQLDATWRAAHVQQLPPPASVKTAREWIGELLVPIDIDVAIEQQRLQDTVTMALWDRTLAPLDVAQSICADYCLPQAFESAIAAQIQQSLTTIEQQFEERFAAIRARPDGITVVPPKSPSADEFEVVDRVNERGEIQNEFLSTLENLHTIDERIRREAEQEFNIDISVSAVTPHIAAERLQAQLSEAATGIPPLYEDLRVIEINFVFANRQFTDRFEWDVACVSNSPDLFAASVGADIGLPRAYVAQLALQLRRAIAAALVLPPSTGAESSANQSYFASGGSSGRSTSKLFGAPVPPPVPVPPRGVALLDETEMRRRVVRIADPVHLQPWTPYFGPLRKYDVDDGDNDMAAAGPRLRRRQTVGFK